MPHVDICGWVSLPSSLHMWLSLCHVGAGPETSRRIPHRPALLNWFWNCCACALRGFQSLGGMGTVAWKGSSGATCIPCRVSTLWDIFIYIIYIYRERERPFWKALSGRVYTSKIAYVILLRREDVTFCASHGVGSWWSNPGQSPEASVGVSHKLYIYIW